MADSFKTVGVFDSGIGGLTVAKSLLEAKLFEELIYYGDTARVPYGTKDRETIIKYSLEAAQFFNNFDIDILVVACNTVSSYALEEMRKVASYEIVGVIEPGVVAVQKQHPDKKANILVIGTKATVGSGVYQKLLTEAGFTDVQARETGLFVPIVEDGLHDSAVLEAAMKHYFKGLEEPDFIILGCTHFPLIATQIQSYFPNAKLVHSGEAIVDYLKQSYPLSGSFETTLRLCASSNPKALKDTAKKWLKSTI